MSDKTELLPCPCCGGEAKEMYTYLTSVEWVACLKCGLETKGYGNAEAAAKAWNTRAPAEDVRAVEDGPVAVRDFANEFISAAYEGGAFDAGDIQDLAVKHGLLSIEPRTEACGDSCRCSEYRFPTECLRKTSLLNPAQ